MSVIDKIAFPEKANSEYLNTYVKCYTTRRYLALLLI